MFDPGGDPKAVVATVSARVRRGNGRNRLLFKGPVTFETDVIRHLKETVLPAVDRSLEHLNPQSRRKTFELSLVNLSMASAADLSLCISGFSTDLAVFLAMLAAALKLPLPQDTVITGHLASIEGDVRAVRNVAAKLTAATTDPSVRRFVCPSLDADTSMKTLSPDELNRAEDAIIEAKAHIEVLTVTDIAEVLRGLLTDEMIVRASLRGGFFEKEGSSDDQGTYLERATTFITTGNLKRFWRVLERALLSANSGEAGSLLQAAAKHFLRRKRCPEDFGRTLLTVIRSVPPATRRLELNAPLLDMEQCAALCQLAARRDPEDARFLMDAIHARIEASGPAGGPGPSTDVVNHAHAAVNAVVAEISDKALARKIGIPVDSARAAFVMQGVIIDTKEDFDESVASFFLSLMRHMGWLVGTSDAQCVSGEAFELIDRAFRDKGGEKAARAEARDGTQGGMRFVLDRMTEQFKREQQAKHVSGVLKRALDETRYEEEVEFIRALLARIRHCLPPELQNEPPERFAEHYEHIAQAYVQSLDHVSRLLRTM